MPQVSRVLVLSYLVDPVARLQVKALQEAAPSLGITLLIREIRTADDLPAAFAAGVKERADGLITTSASIFRVQHARVTELAARHRLPAIYPFWAMADESGGLMAYVVVEPDLQRRAHLHRQNPEGGQACRSRSSAADPLQARHQPEDCQDIT